MERARVLAAVKLPAPLPGRKPKEELRRSERCPAAGIARPGVASAGPGGAGGGQFWHQQRRASRLLLCSAPAECTVSVSQSPTSLQPHQMRHQEASNIIDLHWPATYAHGWLTTSLRMWTTTNFGPS